MALKSFEYYENCSDAEFEDAITHLGKEELLLVASDFHQTILQEQQHFNDLCIHFHSTDDSDKMMTIQPMYLSHKKMENLWKRSSKCLSQTSAQSELEECIGVQSDFKVDSISDIMDQSDDHIDFIKTLSFFKTQTSSKIQKTQPTPIFAKDISSIKHEGNVEPLTNVPKDTFQNPTINGNEAVGLEADVQEPLKKLPKVPESFITNDPILKSTFTLTLSSNQLDDSLHQNRLGDNRAVTSNVDTMDLESVQKAKEKDILCPSNLKSESTVNVDNLISLTHGLSCVDSEDYLLSDSEYSLPKITMLDDQLLNSAGDDELVLPRVTSTDWDPTPLLYELYQIKIPEQKALSDSPEYINLEGFLNKLPEGRKQASYWKSWKKKYFRLCNGYLHCYDKGQSDKGMIKLHLMGGFIEVLDPLVLGIDDGKGHYMVVKTTTVEEFEQWKHALETHVEENVKSFFVHPIAFVPLSRRKNIVIIDIGSSSVRAGFVSTDPCLPQLYFPSICALKRNSNERIYGYEAVHPDIRSSSILTYPIRYSPRLDKFSADIEALPGLFEKIFIELDIIPMKYQILISSSHKYGALMQTTIATILFEKFCVPAVCMFHQSLLALYSYNATSGIVVDVGERIDVLPVTDGYIVKSGITSLPYGGQKITERLYKNLQESNYSLLSEVDWYVVRYVMEQSCYCAYDLKQELEHYNIAPGNFNKTVDLCSFGGNLPWQSITVDSCRFQATEGFFKPREWGLDNKGLHKLIVKAIQECPMDFRKEMFRSIFLTGSVTLLPGFIDRLEKELIEKSPHTIKVQVHASPYRAHAAYVGASVLANLDAFEKVLVWKDEWIRDKEKSLFKWSTGY